MESSLLAPSYTCRENSEIITTIFPKRRRDYGEQEEAEEEKEQEEKKGEGNQ